MHASVWTASHSINSVASLLCCHDRLIEIILNKTMFLIFLHSCSISHFLFLSFSQQSTPSSPSFGHSKFNHSIVHLLNGDNWQASMQAELRRGKRDERVKGRDSSRNTKRSTVKTNSEEAGMTKSDLLKPIGSKAMVSILRTYGNINKTIILTASPYIPCLSKPFTRACACACACVQAHSHIQ